MCRHRIGLILTLVVGIMVLLVPSAAADQVYHSEHVPLLPVTSAPLRSGFVENIHANGPRVFAREIYQLNGAEPNTEYFVSLNFFGTSDCSGPLIQPVPAIGTTFEEVSFTTNAAGNGTSSSVITPDLIDALDAHGVTLNVKWFISTGGYSDAGGTVQYESTCATPTLD